MKNIFVRSNDYKDVIKQRLIFGLCAITLIQAYLPHGESMKKDIDDIMDHIEEMFRSRRKGEEDDGQDMGPEQVPNISLVYNPNRQLGNKKC